jgi:hypothetical protein
MIRNTNAATLAVFWGKFIFISSFNTSFNLFVAHVLQDWQSSVIFKTASPKVRKSIRYSIFADRAATADGLNPFTIIQTAKTIS